MDTHSIAEQAVIEHRALQHIKDALRITLEWNSTQENASRKLSSVHFMAQSLERHLARMMDLEEDGGYMATVLEQRPEWKSRIEPLHADHDRFRASLTEIMHSLKQATARQAQGLEATCHQIRGLLADVDAHDRTECELLQQVILQEDGGEG